MGLLHLILFRDCEIACGRLTRETFIHTSRASVVVNCERGGRYGKGSGAISARDSFSEPVTSCASLLGDLQFVHGNGQSCEQESCIAGASR